MWVNGDLVNDGFGCTAKRGRIAIQAEGAEVEFRKLDLTRIREQSPARAWSDETASPAAPCDETRE